MKKIIYTLILFVAVCLATSCDDMNSIHQEYLDRGARVYIAIPLDVSALSGLERAEVTWSQQPDPRIYETRIFWNNRQDSVTVPVNRVDSVTRHIVSLPEGGHLLEVANFSRGGHHSSLMRTVFVQTFGDNFRVTLVNRAIQNAVIQPDSSIVLTWSVIDDAVGATWIVGTYLTYENRYGEVVTVFIEADQRTVTLTDFTPGGAFTHVTHHMIRGLRDEYGYDTPGSIDEIPANPVTGQFPL